MRYCGDKDIDRLIIELVRQGWTYSRGRHGKLRPPDGQFVVTVPCTPSDHRALLNLKRDIRQASGSDRPDRSRISREVGVRGEQHDSFHHRLRDQHAVERVLV